MTTVHDQREAPPETRWGSALFEWFDRGDPRPVRGPFTRWPRTTDAALAVVVFGLMLVSVTVSELADGEDFTAAAVGDRGAGVFVLLAAAAGALWWRRSRPLAVTAFVLAVMVVWAVAGYGDGHELALAVAIYSVGRYCTDHRQSLIAVGVAFAVSVLGSIIDTSQRVDVWPALVFTALPWYVGRRVRNRGDYVALLRERGESLEAEQQARAQAAVLAERARIARELHDVVAHRVSMITVQAGAAKTIARDDPDAAIEAMGDVEREGREALGELRHLLGVLRRDAADPDQLGPQPGLADVPTLVDHLTHTGAHVTLDGDDLPDDLGAALGLSAYRIVQEACTNIVKHAGPDPSVDISITVEHDALVLDIANTTGATDTTGPGMRRLPASGYGLAGMRERAVLLGGTLDAGPEPPNRFRVTARLPLETEPT